MIIGTVRPDEARVYDSHAGYHQFHAPETQGSFGSFQVFWDDADIPFGTDPENARNYDSDGEPVEAGWYWASCFPGCLYDSDPIGPFSRSQQAHEDADEWAPEYDD
jgi:hypothetical protein